MIERARRVRFSARVLLEMDGHGAYIGNTENISESGVYFTLGYPPTNVTVGEVGLLHPMPLEKRPPLSCQVTRLTDSGIAVRFLENSAMESVSRLVLPQSHPDESARTTHYLPSSFCKPAPSVTGLRQTPP